MSGPRVTDRSIELMLSRLLRVGVTVAGAVVLGGGIYFVLRHGAEPADFGAFHGAAAADRILGQIAASAFALRARSIIQLGVLLLIATPVLRVAFSLAGFALERDRHYVLITLIVLTILLYSLISGALHG
jgi:uncharacterized membrane protein